MNPDALDRHSILHHARSLVARYVDSLGAPEARELEGCSFDLMRRGSKRRSHIVRVRSAERSLILKIRRDPTDDAAREAWALTMIEAGRAGGFDRLSPRLLAHFPGRKNVHEPLGGSILMEEIQGAAPERGPERLRALAAALANLHQVTPTRGPELFCPSTPGTLLIYAKDLLSRIAKQKLLEASDFERARRALLLAASARRVRAKTVRALCHGDPHWQNTRLVAETEAGRSGRIHANDVPGPSAMGLGFIDFELSGIGDPAVDLCLMVARAPLSGTDASSLLESYLAIRNDPTLVDRYSALLPGVRLVSALSAVVASHGRLTARHQRELARAVRIPPR